LVCLDTSVLVALIRKDESAIAGLRAESEKGGVVCTTVVSLCELYSGAYGSKEPEKELAKVQDLVSNLVLLDMDRAAARRYGALANHANLKREPIGDFDLIIASIALENEETLATRNTKHFNRVPGLALVRW
jgi:tRNA(fMet)-specific endonuclease VapC